MSEDGWRSRSRSPMSKCVSDVSARNYSTSTSLSWYSHGSISVHNDDNPANSRSNTPLSKVHSGSAISSCSCSRVSLESPERGAMSTWASSMLLRTQLRRQAREWLQGCV